MCLLFIARELPLDLLKATLAPAVLRKGGVA
jgi:hypothetical protein